MQQNQISDNRLPPADTNDDNAANAQNIPRRVRNRRANNNIFRLGIDEASINFIQRNKVLFLSGKTNVVDPMDETYPSLLKDTICSNNSIISLTSIMFVANCGLFIAGLIIGFNSQASQVSLLQIKLQTLILLGMNDAHLVYTGQIYRLIVAQFLHINILHLLSNMIILMLLVSRLQYSFGVVRILTIYFGSGIAGCIFSDLLYGKSNIISAGSSTSLYGIVGTIIGYMIINWGSLSTIGFLFKFKMIVIVVLSLAYLILFTDVAIYVDYWGHLGGFIGGFFLSSINPSLAQTTRQNVLRVIFISLFAVFIATCFIVFFVHPNSSYQ